MQRVWMSSWPWRWSLAGSAQAIAGIIAFRAGKHVPRRRVRGYAAFWISFAIYLKFFGGGAPPACSSAGVSSAGESSAFYMWIATFRHNTVLQLGVSGLVGHVPAARVGDWFGIPLSAYGGRLPGARDRGPCGLSLRGGIINGDYGRTILPVGPYKPPPAEIARTPGSFHGARAANGRKMKWQASFLQPTRHPRPRWPQIS